jgi:uncharacterized protein (TIGR02444 family)
MTPWEGGLWDWTLAAYARPGAAEACLALQEEHGQNVCLLLWAVWAETEDAALLARGADLARRWDAAAVQPLRAVRRALKAEVAPVTEDAREALRQEVRATELRAERVLLETLEALAARQAGTPALAALKAASRAWGAPAPDVALAALAVAFD